MPSAESGAPQRAAAVRTLRDDDLDAVLTIAQDSPEAANWSRESYRELLRQSGAVGLVWEDSGAVVGFLIGRVVADQAEILNLAVEKDRRRRGGATALLIAALGDFHARGAQSVFLEARDSNAAAIAFYLNAGFEISGRRRAYYSVPLEDAVTMKKKLTG
jgi:ribosomal-protein-alanine N-acetyltransferase